METNGRIEHVNKVGKQIKKACPVELGLALVRESCSIRHMPRRCVLGGTSFNDMTPVRNPSV